MRKQEIKTVGYKILFSTELSDDEVEEAIDNFLREVDAKQMVAHAEKMSQKEIMKTLTE